MSTDYSKLQLSSSASSNKIWRTGTGSFIVPSLPGAGEVFNAVAIPHGLGNRNLLYQVSTTSGATPGSVILPWAPGDNRQIQFAAYDSNNLVIYFISTDSSGLGSPSFTVNYVYRILIP